MKRMLLLAAALVLLSLIVFFVLRIISRPNTTNRAVLKINSIPEATIFLDNQHLGKTPYEDFVAPGEYTLKIIPQTTVEQVVSWEGKIKLTSGLLTYINRELGSSELTSAGEMLTLEKIAGRSAEIAIVSTPDGATVTVDGVEKGETPLILESIEPGEHEVVISSLGSVSRTVKIKATPGYKLTASFQLAITNDIIARPTPVATASATPKASTTPKPSVKPSASATPSATPKATAKPTPPAKPYIEVLDTPTDFLNVRKEPSTTAEILTKIYPGQYYKFIESNTAGDWFKIEYEVGKTGWIASRYAKKVE